MNATIVGPRPNAVNALRLVGIKIFLNVANKPHRNLSGGVIQALSTEKNWALTHINARDHSLRSMRAQLKSGSLATVEVFV